MLLRHVCYVPHVVGRQLWGECSQQKSWDAESFANTWNNLQVTVVSTLEHLNITILKHIF